MVRPTTGALQTPILSANEVTKRYGSLVANDRVSLRFTGGSVHALLGENGAGKTTLMRMAYGLEQPDEGRFEVDGAPVAISSPRVSMQLGIGMVHQHFMLVPTMTVAENVVLGSEPRTRLGGLSIRAIEREIAEFAESRGLPLDPRRRVGDLAVGEQQRVEILRTLYRGARVIALDEPTAVLTSQETERLFEVLRVLREQGTAVVLITHKMREVMAIADEVSVLRHGRLIGTIPRDEASVDELVSMMVGRPVQLDRIKRPVQPGPERLTVTDLVVSGVGGVPLVDRVSFQVCAGEIVGIAGVDGNGQAELVAALSGMTQASSGSISIDGERIAGGVRDALRNGVRYIAEDRHRRGLVLPFSVAENLALRRYRRKPLTRWGWMSPRRMLDFAARLMSEYDVRGPSLQAPAASLSGGNQQKIVIARELEMGPRVLLAAQPTRGLDVGAIEFVHERLLEQQRQGCAVLLVSFELDELRALSDRILVMYEGRVVGTFPPTASDEQLGLAMSGSREEAA